MTKRHGFTLLELMISLTIGGIAITSIYSIGATATRTFHQQQQIASAQSSLRNAVNQVKRDVARAGYLFTPVANAPAGYVQESCGGVGAPLDAPASNGRLAAFTRFTDNVPISTANNNLAVDPTGTNAANGFTVDDIVMFSNYETASEYPGVTLMNNNTIAIDQDWQSFQRDFTQWPAGNIGVLDQAAFNEAFPLGRLMRIQTTRRQRHFATITGVTFPTDLPGQNDVKVQFSPAMPSQCAAETNGGWVAPISALRYFVRNAPAGQGERFVNSTGPIAQLVRSEVQPGNKVTPLVVNLAGDTNTRVVLDYVVGFNLAFTMNTATATGVRDAYVAGALTGDLTDNIAPFTGNAQTIVNANPERIRAVSIEIAVRAPEVDLRTPWTALRCANMGCFQAFAASGTPAVAGSARVRRERADVFVPNVAFEGY